jgi:5,10-methylene-tetrahydrofolate dehydrogenase/methenyl tetrahydrofolate cyclohydrolase
MKKRACASVGIDVQSLDLPAEITQDKLCEEIQRLNGDKTV